MSTSIACSKLRGYNETGLACGITGPPMAKTVVRLRLVLHLSTLQRRRAQHSAMTSAKMSGLFRLLCRYENSARYSGKCSLLTL